ncbi:MAG: NAD(P)(+) transhydrogenase (Re/Si-specific) subunit beta [Deltaproteobacteria bacterium]|nr:NAD(P)(+) transhydrogenase (Re/Si-specific) subunit beta [Deltaproteobacteria bacterium]
MNWLVHILYIVASITFIVGLKMMSRVKTARNGNIISAAGMTLAIIGSLLDIGKFDPHFIVAALVIGGGVGAYYALTVQMTQMPQFVALFNGFGGLASLLVASSFFFEEAFPGHQSVAAATRIDVAVTVAASIFVGAVTFTGSLVAYSKLEGSIFGRKVKEQPILFKGQHLLNLALALSALGLAFLTCFWAEMPFMKFVFLLVLVAAALVMGVTLTIPIGGADMPVVICLLNSYSGIAGMLTGFVIENNLLVVAGSLVGSSGIILTQIMCKAMNRSLANVLFGGFGATATEGGGGGGEYKSVRSTGPEEAAMILESAARVVVAPGYGMAVAQAQHAVREMADLLAKKGVEVTYAIHPVAGRMPGHMNVLLAEANIPYDKLLEMDQVNPEFKNTDVVIVLGANDVVNPAALNDPKSPIYGMPILNVHEARTVFVIKRSLASGFAGIRNDLFEAENTMMLFGDAKKVLMGIVEELKAA